nr:helix-turn-helix domain-containing protein [Streptomyces sp. CRN 30]
MTTADHSFPVAHETFTFPSLARVRRARERFLTGRPLPDGVPEEVVSAWRRARFFGVRPDTAWPTPGGGGTETPGTETRGTGTGSTQTGGAEAGEAGRGRRPAGSVPLLAAARPALERLAPGLDGGRVVLLLTDERSRVLWSSGGAVCRAGADLAERRVGHNSAALALRTGRRRAVHGPEHVLDAWQDTSAVSVPVADPAGRVRGTVTVASPLWPEGAPPPQAALAEAVAALVETELAARSRPAERVLLDAYLAAARGEDRAVVAFGGHSRLVTRAAARLLSPADLDHLERHTGRMRGTGGAADPAAAPREAAAPPSGDAPAAAPVPAFDVGLEGGVVASVSVTPVCHRGSAVGVVAELEPVPRPSGRSTARAGVALAGRSVPWRRAVERAAELAAGRAPMLLTGERGTGKTALARELLDDPLVLDAAERGPDEDALPVDGRPLLLRHAECLARPDTAALNRLLDTRPDAAVVLTYTPGTPPGPCLQRLLDTLSARTVTLPALRERPEDIGELLSAVAPRPAAGHPPLTWTLDALRALERHPWHGNVTELTHVVRALAVRRRTTGPVRRCELPDPVRQGPAARPLSPMEQAERTAILEALRRHGGNKARTATALGIGRATLYRKLRSYQV